MTRAGSGEHRDLVGLKGGTNKLKLATIRWDAEVEELEVELIERGIPPYSAREMAVNMVMSRRRKEYADKSAVQDQEARLRAAREARENADKSGK